MPVIYKEDYDIKPHPDGLGWIKITPTRFAFVEEDKTDVRLDRVREFDEKGNLLCSYLQDKMLCRFRDNLPHTEDDLSYLISLPSRARR